MSNFLIINQSDPFQELPNSRNADEIIKMF